MSDKAPNKSTNKPNLKATRQLSKHAQKYLRGIAHDTKPVVTIADKGITENIMLELEVCLDQHELIKVKLRTDRETRQQHTETIINETGAIKIQAVGQTLTIYRANPKKPVYELPK
jgi:RNA-binding protein